MAPHGDKAAQALGMASQEDYLVTVELVNPPRRAAPAVDNLVFDESSWGKVDLVAELIEAQTEIDLPVA